MVQDMPFQETVDKLVLGNLKVQEKKNRRAKKHVNGIQIYKRLLIKGWEPSLVHVVVSMAGLEIY